jgi:hypothetical protein
MGFQHIYVPTVGYTLAAWPLTVSQLKQLTSPAINAFLQKMGLCRKMGGFGRTPLIDYQGVNQTTLFFNTFGYSTLSEKCSLLDTPGIRSTMERAFQHLTPWLLPSHMHLMAGSPTSTAPLQLHIACSNIFIELPISLLHILLCFVRVISTS